MNYSGLLLTYSQTNTARGWTQVYYSYIVKQTQPGDELRFTTHIESNKHNQGMNSGLLLIYSQTNTTKGWTQVYYSYIVKQTQPGDELRFTTHI